MIKFVEGADEARPGRLVLGMADNLTGYLEAPTGGAAGGGLRSGANSCCSAVSGLANWSTNSGAAPHRRGGRLAPRRGPDARSRRKRPEDTRSKAGAAAQTWALRRGPARGGRPRQPSAQAGQPRAHGPGASHGRWLQHARTPGAAARSTRPGQGSVTLHQGLTARSSTKGDFCPLQNSPPRWVSSLPVRPPGQTEPTRFGMTHLGSFNPKGFSPSGLRESKGYKNRDLRGLVWGGFVQRCGGGLCNSFGAFPPSGWGSFIPLRHPPASEAGAQSSSNIDQGRPPCWRKSSQASR